jgi:hypothetical protein
VTYLFDEDKNFFGLDGRLLASGKVYFCVPDGTANINTLKTIYTTEAKDVTASNPQTLTATGRFPQEVHGTGLYDVVIKVSVGGATVRTLYNVPAGYAADALNVSLTPSSGASATDVQTFLRAIYARTAAEIAASVTPTYYYYPPGDIRRYGAVSGAGDVTTAFAAAALVASSHANYWPAGTWNISSVTLTDNATVRTDGFATNVNQIAGHDGSPNSQKRLVNVAGSNIILGSFKSTGQIATDSGEQQHVVFVYKTGASIDNITIGDIYGQDIRGDVLYIGAPSGFTTTNWSAGRITGNNVLRHVVAIVGASYGHLTAAVQDGACGLCVLDIEPDAEPSGDVTVDYIKGRMVGILPPLAADYADRIVFGTMDLNPDYGGDSTPAYASHIGDVGLQLRNCRHVSIKNARIRNHTKFAIEQVFNPGELDDQRMYIGHLDISNVGSLESTINSPCSVGNMRYVEVASGKISLQTVGDYAFFGNPSPGSPTEKSRFDISDLSCDGTVVRYAYNSRFDGIIINTSNAANAFRDMDNCTISNSDITIPSLMNNGTNVTFSNVEATCSTGYLTGTVADVTFDNCSGGLEGVSSPSQITSNQNDYAVGQAVTDLRLSTDASRDLTGITNGRKGRRLQLFNVGSFDLVLKNDVTSTAANRFLLGADLTIGTNEGVVLWYDTTSSRWRCASRV